MAAAGTSRLERYETDLPPEKIIQQVTAAVASLPQHSVTSTSPSTLVLTRRYTPSWAVALGIIGLLFFLLGVLLFFYKVNEAVTVTASRNDDGRTEVQVSGIATDAAMTRIRAAIN